MCVTLCTWGFVEMCFFLSEVFSTYTVAHKKIFGRSYATYRSYGSRRATASANPNYQETATPSLRIHPPLPPSLSVSLFFLPPHCTLLDPPYCLPVPQAHEAARSSIVAPLPFLILTPLGCQLQRNSPRNGSILQVIVQHRIGKKLLEL